MTRMVKVNGESAVNGVKCITERISPRPRTVTRNSMCPHTTLECALLGIIDYATRVTIPDPDITLTSESKEETYELAGDNRMEVALMSRPTECKAGLPEDFSGKNDDATRWLLAMKAYFIINEKVYTEDAITILIFLNKLSMGRGATFTEGWYMKLANPGIPNSEKTFKKLCKAFEEAFVPKDLKDQAHQTIYSLNMDQYNRDFNKYSTAFKLAQACCRVDDNSILVDALQ